MFLMIMNILEHVPKLQKFFHLKMDFLLSWGVTQNVKFKKKKKKMRRLGVWSSTIQSQ